MNKDKPFCSINNMLDIKSSEAERFTTDYLYPRYWITWLVLILSFFINILPNSWRANIGAKVGDILYKTNEKRRQIATSNLSLCFKNKSKEEIDLITREYFQNLGRSFLDMSILWWRSSTSLRKSCNVENIELLQRSLKKGKGVILLTVHSTSLDFGGRSISNFPVISMYKPFRNKFINWLIGRSRCKSDDNAVIFSRDNFPFKTLVKSLKKPNIFYYIGDEDLSLKESEFADFFDDRKATLLTIRKLAQLTDCIIIPCINIYDKSSGKYVTYLEDTVTDFPTDSPSKDARTINSCFERLISRSVNQYMWSLRIFQNREKGKNYPY